MGGYKFSDRQIKEIWKAVRKVTRISYYSFRKAARMIWISPTWDALYFSIWGSGKYLGPEILQENHIWGLRIAAKEKFNNCALRITVYKKLRIWSLKIETKLKKKPNSKVLIQ